MAVPMPPVFAPRRELVVEQWQDLEEQLDKAEAKVEADGKHGAHWNWQTS